MKKLFAVAVLVLALVGIPAYYFQNHKKLPNSVPPVVKLTPPVEKTVAPVTIPEPAVTDGYVIAVLAVSKSVSTQTMNLKVTNTSESTLALTPNTQFKLVGLKSKTVRLPQSAKTTPSFSGALTPNADLSGSIYFDTLNDEDSELRFYPDPALSTYITVPLIAVPSDH